VSYTGRDIHAVKGGCLLNVVRLTTKITFKIVFSYSCSPGLGGCNRGYQKVKVNFTQKSKIKLFPNSSGLKNIFEKSRFQNVFLVLKRKAGVFKFSPV